ncbi:hypothetical protein ACEXTD_002990 [Salmonella enterica]
MTMENTVIPTVTENEMEEVITSHPAYGQVSVSRTTTTGQRLYGSDLSHKEVITLTFSESEQIERDGVIRHRLAEGRRRSPLLKITLSPAQWATMITSFGMSDGVPCTINSLIRGDYECQPEIGYIESTRERYERQIREASEREMAKLKEKLEALALLVAKGKAGKRELEEVYQSLSGAIGNLPVNLAFSTQLMQESMDKIVSHGKAELEASAIGVAARLGIKEIGRLASLEEKK